MDLTQEEVDDGVEDPDEMYHLKMWIDEKPLAKPSIRYGPGRGGPKGWFRAYTDNKARAQSQKIKTLISNACQHHGYQPIPRNRPVQMKVWFFLRRPDSDFISKQRGTGRLKPSALTTGETVVPVKPDSDNMTKHLLDSLSGVLFVDDAQVVDLHVLKMRDSRGNCEGRIAMEVAVSSVANC